MCKGVRASKIALNQRKLLSLSPFSRRLRVVAIGMSVASVAKKAVVVVGGGGDWDGFNFHMRYGVYISQFTRTKENHNK